jgi:prevent-host-death family protein
MRTVGSRELKNRLGRYLSLVGKGETIIVTDRGKPVAHLIPPGAQQESLPSVEDVLEQLEREGHIRRGTHAFKPFKAIRAKGKPASKIILEDRE